CASRASACVSSRSGSKASCAARSPSSSAPRCAPDRSAAIRLGVAGGRDAAAGHAAGEARALRGGDAGGGGRERVGAGGLVADEPVDAAELATGGALGRERDALSVAAAPGARLAAVGKTRIAARAARNGSLRHPDRLAGIRLAAEDRIAAARRRSRQTAR